MDQINYFKDGCNHYITKFLTAMSSVDHHKSVFSMLMWPLILYGALAGLYVGFLHGQWSWFSWHPMSMLIGFVTLAGNATLIKKIGGYENTKLHGYLMSTALAIAFFGWYVIYSNKEMYGKAHLLSIHEKLGAFVMLGYTGLALFGGIALHPDWGVFKTNQLFRKIHKWGGRFFTAAAWICCVLGKQVIRVDISTISV